MAIRIYNADDKTPKIQPAGETYDKIFESGNAIKSWLEKSGWDHKNFAPIVYWESPPQGELPTVEKRPDFSRWHLREKSEPITDATGVGMFQWKFREGERVDDAWGRTVLMSQHSHQPGGDW